MPPPAPRNNLAHSHIPDKELIGLMELHERASRLLVQFQVLIQNKFPGRDQWDWSRACAAIRGDNVRRNDDQSQDAALADDQDIAQAYDTYIEALHIFYRARDGEKGFLGSRGL